MKWSHFDSAKLVITKAHLPAKLNNVKGHWPKKIKKRVTVLALYHVFRDKYASLTLPFHQLLGTYKDSELFCCTGSYIS